MELRTRFRLRVPDQVRLRTLSWIGYRFSNLVPQTSSSTHLLVLNSLKNLSLEEDSQPNYVRVELETDDEEFCFPPTTHFIATVDDLTDVLDYGSEDIDGMDDDADKEQGQVPPFTGRWTATSLYDVYMADTPKKASDDDKEEPDTNKPSETQSRHRRPKHHYKSRRSKDSNTGTGENSTPGDA